MTAGVGPRPRRRYASPALAAVAVLQLLPVAAESHGEEWGNKSCLAKQAVTSSLLQVSSGRMRLADVHHDSSPEPDELRADVVSIQRVVDSSGELRALSDKEIVTRTRRLMIEADQRLLEAHAKESSRSLELLGNASADLSRSITVTKSRSSSSSSSSGRAGGADQGMVQILKAQLEALTKSVAAEKLERQKNTAGILQLRKQFERFEGTVRQVTASIVQEKSASILQTAMKRVQLQMERVTERQTIIKEVRTIREKVVHVKESTSNLEQVRQVLAMALRQEREGHSEEAELMNRKILFLKKELEKQHEKDVGFVGAVVQMRTTLKDLSAAADRAKDDREANTKDITRIIDRVQSLEDAMKDEREKDTSKIEMLQRQLWETKNNVTLVSQRITAEKERREREMVHIRQTLTNNGEQISELGQGLKDTKWELSRLRDLVTTIRDQQKESHDKITVKLLTQVEEKITATTNTIVQKQIQKNQETTELLVKDLRGPIKELEHEIALEQKLREEKSAEVDALKEQIQALTEKMRNTSSKESITRLEKLILKSRESIRIETVERGKSEMEIESVKDLVNSLVLRVSKESSHLESMTKEIRSFYEKLDLRTTVIEKALVTIEKVSKKAIKSAITLEKTIVDIKKQISREIMLRESSDSKLREVVLTLDGLSDSTHKNSRLIKELQGWHEESARTVSDLSKEVASLRAQLESMMPPCCRHMEATTHQAASMPTGDLVRGPTNEADANDSSKREEKGQQEEEEEEDEEEEEQVPEPKPPPPAPRRKMRWQCMPKRGVKAPECIGKWEKKCKDMAAEGKCRWGKKPDRRRKGRKGR